MNKNITKKPKLTASLDPALFKNCYWDKKELGFFCSTNRLSAQGVVTSIFIICLSFLFLSTYFYNMSIKQIC